MRRRPLFWFVVAFTGGVLLAEEFAAAPFFFRVRGCRLPVSEKINAAGALVSGRNCFTGAGAGRFPLSGSANDGAV